jgi:hypothetical protein
MRTLPRFLFIVAIGMSCVNSFAADTNPTAAPEATTYQIRNVKFQDLLRPRDADKANGTPVVSTATKNDGDSEAKIISAPWREKDEQK